MSENQRISRPSGPPTIDQLKAQVYRPKKAVVTAGMPYANGPIHIGHLAGAHIPADIYARWLRMLIGDANVLYVCGSDDHGSTSELAAMQAGKTVHEFIDSIHSKQHETLKRFDIGLDIYTGTSRSECFETHKSLSQNFLRKLFDNGMLDKRVTLQWYDPKLQRFLQDRFVRGKCPNVKCDNEGAYSDECDKCGSNYNPAELLNPTSALSDATPELRETAHWWLNMWKVSEPLRQWVATKKNQWRAPIVSLLSQTLAPALQFSNTHEPKYKEIKVDLPKHKSKYAAGKKIHLEFETKAELESATKQLEAFGIDSVFANDWAFRSITRDVSWGIPVPEDLDPDMKGKTLYVWPDSLIAPISFSQVALKAKGKNPESFESFWKDKDCRIYQFLGQDNVYFYSLMQGAMWLGTQKDITRLPEQGDYQLNEIFSVYHLMVDGEKMSKSRGNFFTGDQLVDEKGYSVDQLRYFLALLSLPEKSSNFDFKTLDERNKFLAGPMNAAFEKPISACHAKFSAKVPDGKLLEKVQIESSKMIQRYLRSMERGEYSTLLFAIENYARQINSIFVSHKPHDDRHLESERIDGLYSCFYVLKNILIMLYPFVPSTMNRLRESLNLDVNVFAVDQLGTGLEPGHVIGDKGQYFPSVE